jgi:hypothetical protein
MDRIDEILFLYEDDRVERAYGGIIKQGPQKGKHKFMVGKNPQRVEYFDDYDDGKEWEKSNRQRKGYEKPKGKTLQKSELNKASQYFFKKNYDKLDAKQKRKAYDRVRDEGRRTGKAKFKVKTQDKPLTESQQAKIKKEFPKAKFGPRRKYGFSPKDPEYNRVFEFAARDYKKAFETGMFKSLPKYAQKELINAFPDVEFNFDSRSKKIAGASASDSGYGKYGIRISHPRYNQVMRYFDDPKPYRFGFNLRTPGGWTLAQMDRAAMQGDTRYEPILQKPNKPLSRTNKIIGMIDKTDKKSKRYNIDNIMKTHPNRAEIKKYVDVANLSRKPVSEYSNISKLLPKGFDPNKILLNDLLQFIAKDKGGINRAMRAIEIHHTQGVKNKATGSFQLLRRDLNKLADTIEQQISKGNLDRSAELVEKGIRLETDGQKFGPKKFSPRQDFKQIISGVEQELGKFTKTDFKKFKSALQKIGCPGLASGGRTGFQDGTTCFNKGIEKLKGDPKKLSPGDQANLRTLGKSAKAVRFLKNVLGPAAITGELIFEGGVAANKFMEGMPIKQALGESYINKYILGPKTQIDLEAERAKEMERGEEFAMAERGRRKAPFMARSATADAQRLRKREQEMEQAFPTISPEEIDAMLKSQNLTVEDTGLGYEQIQDIVKESDQMQAIANAGGVANMAGGGIAGILKPDAIPPESGPNPQGLENLKYYVTNT